MGGARTAFVRDEQRRTAGVVVGVAGTVDGWSSDSVCEGRAKADYPRSDSGAQVECVPLLMRSGNRICATGPDVGSAASRIMQ